MTGMQVKGGRID